jgi:hypothetical protein
MKIFKIDRGAIGIRSSFSYYFALCWSARSYVRRKYYPLKRRTHEDLRNLPILILSAITGPASRSNPLRGHFRVTLNGFKVNHQTNQGLWASWVR